MTTTKTDLILALYQITGRGECFTIQELKQMSINTLNDMFNRLSNPTTENSRRRIT